MKRRGFKGWTLLEILVAMVIFSGLIMGLTQLLGTAQRAASATARSASFAIQSDQTRAAIRRVLSQTWLNQRVEFIGDSAELSAVSDGHFVCGTASELLPERTDIVGDVVFFQRVNATGQIECGGLFVRYGDDDELRPRHLRTARGRHQAFRLMEWRQPASEVQIFQNTAEGGSALNAGVDRNELYRWFREGVEHPDQCHVVAENVMTMAALTEPSQVLYDSRRHQWDELSPRAVESRHRLPESLTIRLVIGSGVIWLSGAGQNEVTLAARWIKHAHEYKPREDLDGEELRHSLLTLEVQGDVADVSLRWPR